MRVTLSNKRPWSLAWSPKKKKGFPPPLAISHLVYIYIYKTKDWRKTPSLQGSRGLTVDSIKFCVLL